MKYQTIGIAAIGIISTACYAQSTNTVYGVLDVNLASTNTGYGSKFTIGHSGMSATRIGIKGDRVLNGDMKAIYALEAALSVDTGVIGNGPNTNGINNANPSSGALIGNGNQVFSRQAFFGLQNDLGSLTIGRQYAGSYGVTARGNALGTGLFGGPPSLMAFIGGMPTRLNSSILYSSPAKSVSGFSTQISYSTGSENNVRGNVVTGDTTTNSDAGKMADLAVSYASGPVYAGVSTWNGRNNSFATAGETDLATRKGAQAAVSYDFGVAKLFGIYSKGTISGGNYENVTKRLSDADGWSISGSIPMGKGTLLVSYTAFNDNSSLDRSAKMSGITYQYELFEKTTLYASWGEVSNNKNANYGLGNGGDLVGNVSAAGVKASGFMMGLNMPF